MAGEGDKLHPHLFAPKAATSQDFTSPRTFSSDPMVLPVRNRAAHAQTLLTKLDEIRPIAAQRAQDQRAMGIDGGEGIYLTFESTAGLELKFESLDFAPSGIELCMVRRKPNGVTEATVFVPDGKLEFFLKRVTAYRDEQTKPSKKTGETRPKNEDLVASISDIRLAALEALWTDLPELYPDPRVAVMWEVWLRGNSKINQLARFKERAADFGLDVGERSIAFLDRTIVLVHGRGADLAESNEILGAVAELRLAKTAADFFTQMNSVEQQVWVDALIARVTPPTAAAPYICLLDTGVNHAHPLLAPAIADTDLHTYKPQWGVDDRKGHGTPMAGLAMFGDLAEALGSTQPIILGHRLESVKIYNEDDPHKAELYGAVTNESVNRVEILPDRRRIYCLAVSAADTRDRGRPSSWSAAIDALTSGMLDGQRRLMIVSAGNTDQAQRRHYPDANLTDCVHDPAQSWNALTIGGYTEKSSIDQTKFPGWQPLAPAGDLAPASCTSMTWKDTRWPIKPDVVLEAGNMGLHPNFAEPDYIDDGLQLLSTPNNFAQTRPLISFGDTSAATALASRLAALVWAKYPSLQPETVRALIVHSAQWTPAMTNRFTDGNGRVDYNGLVRCYGHGVPNTRRLLSSLDNSLTLIAEGSISPFYKDEDGAIKFRELKLHELPWPKDTLANLQDTKVSLRVTLSYFVEPNPGERGWSNKYGYQSHGLRVAVKRASETALAFQKRINKAIRDEDYDADHLDETGSWVFKGNQPMFSLGSIHSNTWTGQAADLAAREFLAVHPTYGWWNRRPNLKGYEKDCKYSLVASITTPTTDIYTPVAVEIGTPIVVEV
jgi:hypothetical protein